jgi:hypothetical protein
MSHNRTVSLLLFSFASEYVLKKVQENKECLVLNGTNSFWPLLIMLNYLCGENINTR